MAPSRTGDITEEYLRKPKTAYDINIPYRTESEEYERRIKTRTEFPSYLPVWEPNLWFDEVQPFPYSDPALRADISKPHLFTPGVTSTPVTPRMGTILTGVKLETLSTAAKDELALLICERKFVVLRSQSTFLHSGPQNQVDFMEYFGPLSHQPVSGSVAGFPEFHIIHRDANEDEISNFLSHKMSTTLWHHDVSYEHQPPGYVMLGILACPDVGGDTIIADTAEAYKRLSPAFQTMLSKVSAVHSSRKLISHTKAANQPVRSDPVNSEHPVIRVHPVTGEKCIFYNEEFPEEVLGLKDREAEAVMRLVMSIIREGHDFQARVHWEKHSVVMFDGRQTLHTGTVDYDTTAQARHLFRLAAMTEKPISVAESEALHR